MVDAQIQALKEQIETLEARLSDPNPIQSKLINTVSTPPAFSF